MAGYAVAWVGRSYGQFRDRRPVDEGREVTIQYFDPATPAQARLQKRLRDEQVFEKVGDFYDRAFRFPEPLTVRLVNCSSPNAYWDPDARRLRFCYELLETFDKLSGDPAVSRAYDALRQHETMQPNKADFQPPGVVP
jgi:hypothetical protein